MILKKCFCGSSLLQDDYRFERFNLSKCENCRSKFINPLPSEESLYEIYSLYYKEINYNEKAIEAKLLTAESFLKKIDYVEGMKLLDVGAGSGFFCDIAQKSGFEAYAVELSREGSEACKNKLGETKVFEGKFENYKPPSLSFDVVTMIDFIEHVSNPVETLSKANDILKPDGQLIIITPQMNSLLTLVLRKKWPHYLVEHLFYFSRKGVCKIVSVAGFQVISIGIHPKTFTVGYILSMLNKNSYGKKSFFLKILNFMPLFFMDLRIKIWSGDMIIVAKKRD